MPRYFFHLTDGKQVPSNHKGIDLPGDAAVRDDAVVLARDLKHGAVMPGWDWTGWFVAIVDQQGHKVPIADVRVCRGGKRCLGPLITIPGTCQPS
jgi:hypothetical protein